MGVSHPADALETPLMQLRTPRPAQREAVGAVRGEVRISRSSTQSPPHNARLGYTVTSCALRGGPPWKVVYFTEEQIPCALKNLKTYATVQGGRCWR